jgi:phenylacetate-CoA ligase
LEAVSIDFKIKDFAYPLSIWSLRRTLERTQWLPPDELEAYQLERLRRIIDHAWRNVPYYRLLFEEHGLNPSDLQSLEDLKKLPLLTKDDARRAGSSLHAKNAYRYLPKPQTTSGTTGRPLKFLLDKDSNALEFVYYWRHWNWAGYRLGDRVADINTGYFLRRPHLKDAVSRWQPHLRRLVLNSARLSERGVREMAAAVRRHRPSCIKGMASTLYYLSVCLEAAGIHDLEFKAAFSTGEVLSDGWRKKIVSALGCPVLDSYGHMERTVAICECPSGGYHLNSDYGVLELTGERSSEAFGTVIGRSVGTSLYNLAMPLIRYDIGDLIEMQKEPSRCHCGRTLPLVKSIRGRTQDVIKTPDGRYLTAVFILPEFVSGIGFAQFVQKSADELEILVIPTEEWNSSERDRLQSYASRLLGPEMRLNIHTATPADIASDPSGKQPVVISAPKD